MRTEKYEFESAHGATLAGRLELPALQPQAYAVFAHCFTCSKETKAASRISRALAEKNIAVLRFDFTGLGQSGGDFANTNFSSNVADLVAAAKALEKTHQAPSLLIGHSLGGAAVLMAASKVDACKAVVTINAPCHPEHVEHLIGDDESTIEQQGKANVSIGGRSFTITKQFVDDLKNHRMEEAIGELKRALLVMHSPVDEIVGIENARRIFEHAKHPKSYVSLDDANHLMTDKRDSQYAASVIAGWVMRYLEIDESRPTQDGVRVTETGMGKFSNEVRCRDHLLVADEPTDVGGQDAGLSPYDFLLAGLGACTNMTLRLYAQHKGWPLEQSQVELSHAKTHAKDCEDCEDKGAKIDRIARRISLKGDLTDQQRERLIQIANKCPVHKTLHSEVHVETSLKDD